MVKIYKATLWDTDQIVEVINSVIIEGGFTIFEKQLTGQDRGRILKFAD
jgi:hypothetical protein